MDFVVGVDLGTGGVRAVAAGQDGTLLASASRPVVTRGSDGRREQRVDEWLEGVERVLDELFSSLSGTLLAIAVTSTSGTVACDGTALLYSDGRARDDAPACSFALGTPMNATWGLPKMRWLARHGARGRFLHAGDVLNEWLLGESCATDFTSALKSGYDGGWPEEALARLGISTERLPRVVAPGTVLGRVRSDLCRRWGMEGEPRVVAGVTDANAAFYASGATRTGEWSSAIGSTLAVRCLASREMRDPMGRFYSHRHPDGGRVVAGASSAGLAGMPEVAWEKVDPTVVPAGVWYPLVGTGERLPFASDTARAIWCGPPCGDNGAAFGLALVERWIYALAESLGASRLEAVFTTGGGARLDVLSQVRANVLEVPVVLARCPDAAFGAAIVAASGATGRSVTACAETMVREERRFEPSALSGTVAALERLRTAMEDASPP